MQRSNTILINKFIDLIDDAIVEELEKKYEETNKQCQAAYNKYLSLSNKTADISDSIDRLYKKYTSVKKVKLKNPHYIAPSY